MTKPELFERLWNGSSQMEEWTDEVSAGQITSVTDEIISVHTTYFCGSVTAIRTSDGLVVIDTAKPDTAARTLELIRSWSDLPIHTVIYTHGHIDHTSGIKEIDDEARSKGRALPIVVGHRNVSRRLDRYELTHGYNSIVQGQQFNRTNYSYPIGQRRPDVVYDVSLQLDIGGKTFQLFHGRGETDDATYVWLPQDKVLVSGDFVAWIFPNAGNPRKVQRYVGEWAQALRHMDVLSPNTLIPGHGPVIFGKERASMVLRDGAEALEWLNGAVIDLINQGASLDDVLHSVKLPSRFLEKSYLQSKYDDVEFLIRGIYHLYAGWFDGNAANLKPPPYKHLAEEVTRLAGGTELLVARSLELLAAGETRLALSLIEFAFAADRNSTQMKEARFKIITARIDEEKSLMGKAFLDVFRRRTVDQN